MELKCGSCGSILAYERTRYFVDGKTDVWSCGNRECPKVGLIINTDSTHGKCVVNNNARWCEFEKRWRIPADTCLACPSILHNATAMASADEKPAPKETTL